MRRLLVIVGGVTLALVAAVALGVAVYAPEGRRLDASSREYASQVLDAALKNWDVSAVRSESSEELLAAVPAEKLEQLLRAFAGRLGPIRSHGLPRGESRLNVVPFRWIVTADYLVPTTFEKAGGQISLRLILKGDRWRVLALHVNSEALLP